MSTVDEDTDKPSPEAPAQAEQTTGRRQTRRRRRSQPSGPHVTTIRWRDIPVQVQASHGSETVKRQLPNRFTVAADAAAMQAGLDGSDDYLDQWRQETQPCGTDLEAAAQTAVQALVAAHPQDVLQALVRAGGVAADADDVPGETHRSGAACTPSQPATDT